MHTQSRIFTFDGLISSGIIIFLLMFSGSLILYPVFPSFLKRHNIFVNVIVVLAIGFIVWNAVLALACPHFEYNL